MSCYRRLYDLLLQLIPLGAVTFVLNEPEREFPDRYHVGKATAGHTLHLVVWESSPKSFPNDFLERVKLAIDNRLHSARDLSFNLLVERKRSLVAAEYSNQNAVFSSLC